MNRKVCLLLLTLIVGLCIAFVPGVPTAHAAAAPSTGGYSLAHRYASLAHRYASLAHRTGGYSLAHRTGGYSLAHRTGGYSLAHRTGGYSLAHRYASLAHR